MPLLTRPTPIEIFDGVQHAVARTVIPELRSDDARAQLSNAIGLLRYLATEFDAAADSLSNDITDVREALATSVPELRAAGSRELVARLQSAIDSDAPDLRIPSLLARLDELQEALLETLLYLETATEEGATNLAGTRDSLRATLVALNRRQRN